MNKKYTIEEVLGVGMNKPTLFEDEFGIIYKSTNGYLFVWDEKTPLSLTLDVLSSEFTMVNEFGL